VVLNRVAAEPLGAAESSRGAANFWIWLVFISKMQLEVPPNLKKLRKAAANQKRLKNTALVFILSHIQDSSQDFHLKNTLWKMFKKCLMDISNM